MFETATYNRTFILQSCHMNGGDVYSNYTWSLAAKERGDWQEAFNYLEKVIPEIHGHNFKIVVSAKGQIGKEGYVIDDPLLDKILKRWDNVNLSTLPEFGLQGVRATTENMANMLLDKIWATFPLESCKVEVWETDQICAVAENEK